MWKYILKFKKSVKSDIWDWSLKLQKNTISNDRSISECSRCHEIFSCLFVDLVRTYGQTLSGGYRERYFLAPPSVISSLTHTRPRLVWFEKVCMPSRIWKRQKNVFLFSQVTWRNSCFRKTGISRNPSSPPPFYLEKKKLRIVKKNYQLTSWDGTLKFPSFCFCSENELSFFWKKHYFWFSFSRAKPKVRKRDAFEKIVFSNVKIRKSHHKSRKSNFEEVTFFAKSHLERGGVRRKWQRFFLRDSFEFV